jgi:hypothetical protein
MEWRESGGRYLHLLLHVDHAAGRRQVEFTTFPNDLLMVIGGHRSRYETKQFNFYIVLVH